MKRTATLAALFSVCVTGAAFAQPIGQGDAPACIPSNNIATMEALNRNTVLIHTGDGDVYSSRVQTPCAGLGPRSSVSIGTPQGGALCSGRDVVKVADRGTCRLGRFMHYKTITPGTDIRDPRTLAIP
jgi:hypothetical protein